MSGVLKKVNSANRVFRLNADQRGVAPSMEVILAVAVAILILASLLKIVAGPGGILERTKRNCVNLVDGKDVQGEPEFNIMPVDTPANDDAWQPPTLSSEAPEGHPTDGLAGRIIQTTVIEGANAIADREVKKILSEGAEKLAKERAKNVKISGSVLSALLAGDGLRTTEIKSKELIDQGRYREAFSNDMDGLGRYLGDFVMSTTKKLPFLKSVAANLAVSEGMGAAGRQVAERTFDPINRAAHWLDDQPWWPENRRAQVPLEARAAVEPDITVFDLDARSDSDVTTTVTTTVTPTVTTTTTAPSSDGGYGLLDGLGEANTVIGAGAKAIELAAKSPAAKTVGNIAGPATLVISGVEAANHLANGDNCKAVEAGSGGVGSWAGGLIGAGASSTVCGGLLLAPEPTMITKVAGGLCVGATVLIGSKAGEIDGKALGRGACEALDIQDSPNGLSQIQTPSQANMTKSNSANTGKTLEPGVYVGGRDLNVPVNPAGTHQYVVMVPEDPTQFEDARDLGDGTYGIVVGAHNRDGRLQVRDFEDADVEATQQLVNPDEYRPWFGSYSPQLESVELGDTPVDDAIRNVLEAAEQYKKRESEENIEYPSFLGQFDPDCINSNSWAQSVVDNAIGEDRVQEDFRGADTCRQNRIDSSYFQTVEEEPADNLPSDRTRVPAAMNAKGNKQDPEASIATDVQPATEEDNHKDAGELADEPSLTSSSPQATDGGTNAYQQSGGTQGSSPGSYGSGGPGMMQTSPGSQRQRGATGQQTQPQTPQRMGSQPYSQVSAGRQQARAEASSWRVLAKNMLAAGLTRPANSRSHHIVSGTDARAAQGRAALKSAGIDVNDAANGVFLPLERAPRPGRGVSHANVRSDRYFAEVNRRLSGASVSDVPAILAEIAEELGNGTFSH